MSKQRCAGVEKFHEAQAKKEWDEINEQYSQAIFLKENFQRFL